MYAVVICGPSRASDRITAAGLMIGLAVEQFAEAARWQELVHQPADDKTDYDPEGRLGYDLPDGGRELMPGAVHRVGLLRLLPGHAQGLRDPGLLGLELDHEIRRANDDQAGLGRSPIGRHELRTVW